MGKDDDRFIVTYKQASFAKEIQILVDKETGVNYLLTWYSQGVGLTPLLDKYGKPVITPVVE